MDAIIVRTVVQCLGVISCLGVVGVVICSVSGHEPPAVLGTVTGTAVGGLLGILVPIGRIPANHSPGGPSPSGAFPRPPSP